MNSLIYRSSYGRYKYGHGHEYDKKRYMCNYRRKYSNFSTMETLGQDSVVPNT